MKKLGPNAFPFIFELPKNAPPSVTLQPGPEASGKNTYVLCVFGFHQKGNLTI